MNIGEKVTTEQDRSSIMELSDIDEEERFEDAKNAAALVGEEILVGVGKCQNNEGAAKNERKMFNKWP